MHDPLIFLFHGSTMYRLFPLFLAPWCWVSCVLAQESPAESLRPTLVALGSVAATSMVATEGLLGVMADGIAEGLYKRVDEVEPDLTKLIASLDASHRNLRLAQASPLLEKSDRAFLGEVCEVIALQKQQAQSLIAFAQSKPRNLDHLRLWKAAREKSETAMKRLLGDDHPAKEVQPRDKPIDGGKTSQGEKSVSVDAKSKAVQKNNEQRSQGNSRR